MIVAAHWFLSFWLGSACTEIPGVNYPMGTTSGTIWAMHNSECSGQTVRLDMPSLTICRLVRDANRGLTEVECVESAPLPKPPKVSATIAPTPRPDVLIGGYDERGCLRLAIGTAYDWECPPSEKLTIKLHNQTMPGGRTIFKAVPEPWSWDWIKQKLEGK